MVWACGMLYEAVLWTLLQSRSKSWVVTGAMLKVLEGFRHREAQRVSGMTARSTEDEEWEYPPVTDALESVGIW